MTPILDTHVLLWLALDSKKLSRAARRAIDQGARRGGLCVASITLWEVAQLAHLRRIAIQGTVSDWMAQLLSATGVGVIELDPVIAELSTAFGPGFPKDPADRIIAATARARAVPLITADVLIRESSLVKTIW